MDYQLFNNIDEIKGLEKDTEAVKDDIYALWQECFEDSSSYTNFYFQWKVKKNRILTIYKDRRLTSMLHLNPYTVMVRGRQVSANYIVGVATSPLNRRQGLMKKLLEASLHQMYLEHMPFTYLMPAAEAIYLPFGFRTVYKQTPWNELYKQAGNSVSAASVGKFMTRQLTVMALEASDRERTIELVLFSNRLLAQFYDIYTYRTEYYYTRLIHEMESTGGKVLLCYEKEQLVGFLSYMAEGDIYITECLCSITDKVAFMRTMHDYISNNCGVLRAAQVSVEEHNVPSIMARIVDWESFITLLSAKEELKLVIEVRDPIIHENDGVYTLLFSPQGCECTKTQEEPEVSAAISELTRLFFGRLTKEEDSFIVNGADRKSIWNKINQINSFSKVFINDVV